MSCVEGCLTSILCGGILMKMAHKCWTSQKGLTLGFAVETEGGYVMGFSLVSLDVALSSP